MTLDLDVVVQLVWLSDVKAGHYSTGRPAPNDVAPLVYLKDGGLTHAVRALLDAGEIRSVPAVWPNAPNAVQAITFKLTEKGELELIRLTLVLEGNE